MELLEKCPHLILDMSECTEGHVATLFTALLFPHQLCGQLQRKRK